MTFNFIGVRDVVDFPDQQFYAAFLNFSGDVNSASDSDLYAAEVLDIARVLVVPQVTTNQLTVTKIYTLPSINAITTFDTQFNSIILTDAASGVGTYIVAKYQTNAVQITTQAPVRVQLGKILLTFID